MATARVAQPPSNTAPEYPATPASMRGDGGDPDARIVETETEARAGVTGHGVRTVLFVSLAAVVVAFVVVYAVFLKGV